MPNSKSVLGVMGKKNRSIYRAGLLKFYGEKLIASTYLLVICSITTK